MDLPEYLQMIILGQQRGYTKYHWFCVFEIARIKHIKELTKDY